MQKKYTKEQIEESIKYWKNQLKKMNESYEKPIDIAFSSRQPLTVKMFKDNLNKFKDVDVVDVCLPNGEPGYTIVQLWNANTEFEMTGEDDGRDDVCYMRVMPSKINESKSINEASWEEANEYHRSYLALGEYLAPYIDKANKSYMAGQNVITSGGKAMPYVEAMFALAEYVLNNPDAQDWQKEVAKKVAQLGAGYMI